MWGFCMPYVRGFTVGRSIVSWWVAPMFSSYLYYRIAVFRDIMWIHIHLWLVVCVVDCGPLRVYMAWHLRTTTSSLSCKKTSQGYDNILSYGTGRYKCCDAESIIWVINNNYSSYFKLLCDKLKCHTPRTFPSFFTINITNVVADFAWIFIPYICCNVDFHTKIFHMIMKYNTWPWYGALSECPEHIHQLDFFGCLVCSHHDIPDIRVAEQTCHK